MLQPRPVALPTYAMCAVGGGTHSPRSALAIGAICFTAAAMVQIRLLGGESSCMLRLDISPMSAKRL